MTKFKILMFGRKRYCNWVNRFEKKKDVKGCYITLKAGILSLETGILSKQLITQCLCIMIAANGGIGDIVNPWERAFVARYISHIID